MTLQMENIDLEEVKHWIDGGECADGLPWDSGDRLYVKWLIAEVERLNIMNLSDVTLSDWAQEHLAEIDRLRVEVERLREEVKQQGDYYIGALDRKVEGTAVECVEIAKKYFSCEGIAQQIAIDIKERFSLEGGSDEKK